MFRRERAARLRGPHAAGMRSRCFPQACGPDVRACAGHADQMSGHADQMSGHADQMSGHADQMSGRMKKIHRGGRLFRRGRLVAEEACVAAARRDDIRRSATTSISTVCVRVDMASCDTCWIGRVSLTSPDQRSSITKRAMSVGNVATLAPAFLKASILEAAVPMPRETMAPAWPMRFPSGAARPAMYA